MAMGRPTKLTEDVEAKLIEWIRAGNYIETAAALCGVSKGTVFGWLRRGQEQRRGRYRDFLNAVRGAQAQAESRMLLYIEKSAKKDWRAAAWRLEHMRPRRYAQSQRIEHTGRRGGPIETRELSRLSDDELEAIARGDK